MLNGAVADHMAPFVIDLFKEINIDNRYRQRQVILNRQGDFMLEHHRQIATVKQVGQCVFAILHLRQTTE